MIKIRRLTLSSESKFEGLIQDGSWTWATIGSFSYVLVLLKFFFWADGLNVGESFCDPLFGEFNSWLLIDTEESTFAVKRELKNQ